MDELAIISQGNQSIETATIHFSAMTTFVAVYIAALYAFLRKAPLAVRLIAYIFFVGSFVVFIRLGMQILINLYTTLEIQRELAAGGPVSDAYRAWLSPDWYDAIPVGLLWYALVTMTIVALGWLTFFFDWKQEGEE